MIFGTGSYLSLKVLPKDDNSATCLQTTKPNSAGPLDYIMANP